MSQRTFRHDLRAAYEDESLPSRTRERLVSMTEAFDAKQESRWPRTAWLVAALVLVALSVLVLRGALLGPAGAASPLVASIAEEIAHNHFKAKHVDFVGDSIGTLRARMTELDFRLADVSSLVGSDVRLLGGRYCSIQGEPAAQLKLETGTGEVLTMYQVHLVDRFESLPQGRIPHEALQIELQQIDGVLVGLARAPR